MGRAPCCSKVGLRRGPWSSKEDSLLSNFIQEHGEGQWRSLPKKAGLLRCGKSCRLRWMNYLRPGILRGNITEDEEDLIVRLHALLGNRWSLIAGRLPGRTDNEIKNYWNTHLLKKLNSSGVEIKPDLPKTKKLKTKPRKKKKNIAEEKKEMKSELDAAGNKTKVYLPKAIRVSSSVFSRTNSCDSLVSTDASAAAAEVAPYYPVAWPPLFELEGNYGEAEEEEFMGGGGCILPVLNQSSDVDMWEKVYDEYLQLLH